MENSATKALSFPNWAKLRRDKENYPDWRSHIIDLLQAMGCDQAIRDDFLRLTFNSDDDSSSDDDSDGIDFSRLDFSALDLRGVGRERHFPQPSPTPSQEQLQEQRIKQLYDSLQLSAKKAKKEKIKERQRRRKEKKFEEKKRRMDARARNAINSTIDSKAFAPSLMDCKTAHDLWMALKPTEACTQEEVHRALDRVRLETCANDMELVERMHIVVNKVTFNLPEEREQYETRTVQAALLNLKQKDHKTRFFELLLHMGQRGTPQTVKEFEGQFLRVIKEEKEVEQHNRHNKSSRQAAYNATTKQDGQHKTECDYCHKKGHTENKCFKKQRDEDEKANKTKAASYATTDSTTESQIAAETPIADYTTATTDKTFNTTSDENHLKFLLDSGSTCHIVTDSHICQNVRHADITITVGNENKIKCHLIGDIFLQLPNGLIFKLKDVRIVPTFGLNVFSWPTAAKANLKLIESRAGAEIRSNNF